MSFDINPAGRNLSNVQASAKSQDGGGGNTGYFQRDEQEEEKKQIDTTTQLYPSDSFEKFDELKIEDENSQTLWEFFKDFVKDMIEAFKNLFAK